MPLTTTRDPLSHILYDTGDVINIPTALTQEIAAESFVVKVEMMNCTKLVLGTAANRTVSAYDGNGVPVIPPHVLADNDVITYTAAFGRRMKGGVWWVADGLGCKGYISGYLA